MLPKGSYSFDGSNEYISIQDDPDLDLTRVGSISLWFRRDRVPQQYERRVHALRHRTQLAARRLGIDPGETQSQQQNQHNSVQHHKSVGCTRAVFTSGGWAPAPGRVIFST